MTDRSAGSPAPPPPSSLPGPRPGARGPLRLPFSRTLTGARLLVLVFLLAALLPASLRGQAQEEGPNQVRIGLSVGGISFMGLLVEYAWRERSVELTVGTWAFRDLSLSVVGKEYLGPGSLRPFFGAGFWMVISPPRERELTAVALLLRAPVGVDWSLTPDHHLGGALSINRALYIRRRDPRDDTPPSRRFVPLPGFYYRWNH